MQYEDLSSSYFKRMSDEQFEATIVSIESKHPEMTERGFRIDREASRASGWVHWIQSESSQPESG